MPKAERQNTKLPCLKRAAANRSQTKITSLFKDPVPILTKLTEVQVRSQLTFII